MKRETKIRIATLIAAIVSTVVIVAMMSGIFVKEEEKMSLIVFLFSGLIAFAYCLILDKHRPDLRWKEKLSGIYSLFFAGFLLVSSHGNMSMDLILRILILSCIIFVIYYVFLYIVEKIHNHKMKLLRREQA